jgi:hypothetical protein
VHETIFFRRCEKNKTAFFRSLSKPLACFAFTRDRKSVPGDPLPHILVYGDSLTWGIVPDTRKRFPFEERWPGILENKLNALGRRVRITEDCLNGRRTVWDDPFKRRLSRGCLCLRCS